MEVRFSQTFKILLPVTSLLWVLYFWLLLFWVPPDAEQGLIQRIFYVHVPAAWVSFLGFIITFIYSIWYLVSRDLKRDQVAASAALVGWIFTTGALITGPIWAKPIWGHYWNWSDQRLVSFFILWLGYAAYLILRMGIHEEEKRARFSAVLGILAFIDVPLVYLSIRIWNTPSHPGPVIGGDRATGLGDIRMVELFWYAMVCYTILFYIFTRLSINYTRLRNKQTLESE